MKDKAVQYQGFPIRFSAESIFKNDCVRSG